MSENTEGAINNGQSRETGNIQGEGKINIEKNILLTLLIFFPYDKCNHDRFWLFCF